MRSMFDPINDAYDVFKGIVYSDLETLVRLTYDEFVYADKSAFYIARNLETTLNYYKRCV